MQTCTQLSRLKIAMNARTEAAGRSGLDKGFGVKQNWVKSLYLCALG